MRGTERILEVLNETTFFLCVGASEGKIADMSLVIFYNTLNEYTIKTELETNKYDTIN